MRSYRLALDRQTREIVALGRDGRQYTIEDLERAEEGAARGEPEALETIRDVELTPPDSGDGDGGGDDQAGA